MEQAFTARDERSEQKLDIGAPLLSKVKLSIMPSHLAL